MSTPQTCLSLATFEQSLRLTGVNERRLTAGAVRARVGRGFTGWVGQTEWPKRQGVGFSSFAAPDDKAETISTINRSSIVFPRHDGAIFALAPKIPPLWGDRNCVSHHAVMLRRNT